MAYVMTNDQFIEKLRLALSCKTAYMWGTFGQPISNDLINSKQKQYPKNYTATRVVKLKALIHEDYFAFDCVGLIKGVLWNWSADHDEPRGGATYGANNVPDTNVNGFRKFCNDMSEDFSNIKKGELVFMPGHIGVYVGNGKCIESTLGNGRDGVVETELQGRGWKDHGKCQFIEYIKDEEEMDNLYIHVDKVGLYMRDALPKKVAKKIVKGNIVGFCKVGNEMKLTEFVPGIQCDGYQWVKVKASGYSGKEVEAYAQYDSQCYYLFNK